MTGKLLVATILCLMGGSVMGDAILEGNYNVTAFCTCVKTGTQLGSIESCQSYYVCQSTGPVKAECQTGYSYDYKRSGCYPSSQVECYWGVNEPCAGKTNVFVPNTAVCGGYYWCSNGVSSKAKTCATGQVFNNDQQACIWGSCPSTTDSSNETVLTNLCDVVPPGQYFGDTSNCSIWYNCKSNSSGVYLEKGECSTDKQTAFNPSAQNCDYTTTSNICSRVTGVPLSETAATCTSGTQQPDANVCGQYQVCVNSKWTTVVCNTGYYYDVDTKACVLRQLATPVSTCNRCQGAQGSFVNAVDSKDCSTYYWCSATGVASQVESCTEDRFFNEDRQGCVPDSDLSGYVPTHGACKGASVTDDDSTDSTDEAEATTEAGSG
ncbi:peritrophin-48 [Drosophila ficusphila]|uniref:peritrophin-48 n=1 Tax=Drosophila ficusphila TaxID=30025 RepID=UPI0007E7C740|nr:peritrophin-48 [Drosophila ficusphila]